MIAIVILGARGFELAGRIKASLADASIHAPRSCVHGVERHFDRPTEHLRGLFEHGRPIVFIGAAAIAIRSVAPALGDKHKEPPLLVVAEDGSAVIPLLGGHHGANDLARQIAQGIGAVAAITTAGDLRLGLALDVPPAGFACSDPLLAKAVTAHLLEGGSVDLHDPAGLAEAAGLGNLPRGPAGGFKISITHEAELPRPKRLVWHSKTLVVGIGCERNVQPDALIEQVEAVLAAEGLAVPSIACIASIDIKADEPALAALAARWRVPVRLFSGDELAHQSDRLSTRSAIVFRETGCYGVAEGAALAAVGGKGRLLMNKHRGDRITCAVALAPVPVDPTKIGRARGRLAIVGIGPGRPGWRTAEAVGLLREAQDVVGYGLYLDLVGDLSAHCVRHDFALGEEEARCRHALGLAASGRDVALVCSGDAGIFAMASPLVELLEQPSDPAWARVNLIVVPGISAMQAAAARLGAPLGHDFCAISLSDLLTPRADIERRLKAAADGDFVIAFYNPVSRRRRDLLPFAKQILLRHRPNATPVAIAKSLGRSEETIAMTTLADMDCEQVDMLSLVLIGSSNSRLVTLPSGRPLVLTPRGYDRKARP